MKILAIVAEVSTATAALDAALAAAQALPDGASIEALHVIVDPRAVAASEEEVAVQQLRDAKKGDVNARAEAMRTRFTAWLAGLPDGAPRVGWREIAGDEAPAVTAEAKGADLLVLAQPKDMDGYDALHAALFDAGRPLLMVPGDWRSSAAFPGIVLIAWDGSEQAALAIDGAMPWLAAAAGVTILAVDGGSGDPTRAIERLRAAGIEAECANIEKSDDGVAATLLGEARRRNAGLLVAGAYRRNRVAEWLFGGVTRELLDHPELPILFAH